MTASLQKLTLIAPPALEETLVDWLMQAGGESFISSPVSGHLRDSSSFSLAEQVSGRKRQCRFEVMLTAEELPVFLEGLRKTFAGTGMHYWVSAVEEAGRF
jgi:hypothetical protein